MNWKKREKDDLREIRRKKDKKTEERGKKVGNGEFASRKQTSLSSQNAE